MSKHSDPIWVEELLSQAGWVRRLSGELVTGDLAEDVSQDVLVASLHRPPGDRSAPRAWLKTVVNNMARSRFRSDRRRHDREVLTLKGTSAPGESPEDLVARMELQRFLAEQILALGELQRQAIIMRYIDGLSAADIARSLGLPAGTIRRRLKEGLDRLRQTLDERHGRREVWMRALLPLMPQMQVQVQVDVGWSRGPGSSPAPAPAAAGSRSIGWLAAAGIAGLLVVAAGIGVRSLWARRNAAGPVRAESLAVRIDPPRLRPAAPTPDTGDRAGANQAQVTGQVRDAGGRPAGGVTVTLASLDTSRPFGTTSTGADGRFEFAQVPAGDFGITASGGPGWAARAPITVRPSASTAVELVLEQAAGTLEGRVFDAGGGGLAGVTVTVWSGRQGWSPERVFERRTDEAGNYRLVLPVGRYLFRAKRTGYSRAEGWLDVPGRRRFDVRMLPGSRLTGRIVEGATGSPLADVQVTVVSAAGRPRTAETDASGGFSIDQIAAAELGKSTRFKSLELGVSRRVRKDEGLTPQILSHNGPDSGNPPSFDPGEVFTRLFGGAPAPGMGGSAPGGPAAFQKAAAMRRSVLDAVVLDIEALKPRVGSADRRRLEQHFENVRAVEKRLQTGAQAPGGGCAPPASAPGPFPDTRQGEQLEAITTAMSELLALALACDLTRVFSVLFSGSIGGTVFWPAGVTRGHHGLTHVEAGDQPQIQATTVFTMKMLGVLLQKLKDTPDGAGNLLDSSAILATTDCAEGKAHSIRDYPILVAGRAGGFFKYPGVHHRELGGNTSTVLMSLLRSVGVNPPEVGAMGGRATTGLSAIEATGA